MSETRKTKEQLANELAEAHRRIAELETSKAELERVEKTLEQRATQLALINDVSQQVTAVLESDKLIDRVAHLVHDSFDYDHVTVLIIDHEQDEMVMKAHVGSLAHILPVEYRMKLKDGLTGWVACHGETLLVNDVNTDPRYFNPFPDIVKTHSELDVPIRIGEKILGVFSIQDPRLGAFDENDVMVLETLTSQIAVTIENARLYETVQRELIERERAEKEQARLHQEIIEAQRQAMRTLSTPIIPVMEHIIVMPLIGNIDTMRARDITRSLLAGIQRHRAKVVILDITGVSVVDSKVANYLNKTIQAARLKGARTIVTGISDAVAEIIVDLGIDWSGIKTLSDLQTGLGVALNVLGVKLTR